MKLLPMLLLNLATVGVALFVYDQARSASEPANVVMERGADTEALEQRIRDLEAARAPSLTATGTDPRLVERITALEAAAGSGGTDEPGEHPQLAGRGPSRPATLSDAPPTDDEIRWFRKLRNAAQRADRIKRNAGRVDRAIEKAGLKLSKQQRTRIYAAFTDFEPQVDVFWREAKREAQETMRAGGKIDRMEIVETTTAAIQDAFVDEIDDVVSQADAESIARALMPGGK